MDPVDISVALSIFMGSTGVVAIALMAARVVLRRWSTRKVDPPGNEAVRELQEAVGRLSEEIVDLHERMDFAERLVAASREPERLHPGES